MKRHRESDALARLQQEAEAEAATNATEVAEVRALTDSQQVFQDEYIASQKPEAASTDVVQS